MSISRLDDTWLPRLAARAQRAATRMTGLVERCAGPSSPAGQAARAEPALAGSIAAVLIAALLVGVFGPHEPTDHDGGAEGPVASVAPPQQTLGPRPGTSVADYLTTASFDLRHFGEISHGKTGFALVHLRAYLTPAQVAALLPNLPVSRAFVRVPSATLFTSVYPVNLRDDFGTLASGMQAQGRFAGLNARTYAQIVSGFNAHTDREKREKRLYAQLASASAYESTALASPAACACVFAVLLRADFVHLAALTHLPQVRAVDPAPPSVTLDQLSLQPLRPDVTTVVPRPGVFGAG